MLISIYYANKLIAHATAPVTMQSNAFPGSCGPGRKAISMVTTAKNAMYSTTFLSRLRLSLNCTNKCSAAAFSMYNVIACCARPARLFG